MLLAMSMLLCETSAQAPSRQVQNLPAFSRAD
jgi:hypothetical protein